MRLWKVSMSLFNLPIYAVFGGLEEVNLRVTAFRLMFSFRFICKHAEHMSLHREFCPQDKLCHISPSLSCDVIMWMEVEDIFHFVISQAFYIISDEILISQGNKSTIVCQQCWLKGHTRDIRDLLTKKAPFIK